jgi:hypothetical protein
VARVVESKENRFFVPIQKEIHDLGLIFKVNKLALSDDFLLIFKSVFAHKVANLSHQKEPKKSDKIVSSFVLVVIRRGVHVSRTEVELPGPVELRRNHILGHSCVVGGFGQEFKIALSVV